MPCTLRLVGPEDLERVMRWRMLPEITRFMYTDPVLTLAHQQRWFERVRNDPSSRHWIIELTPSTQPVGLLSLSDIDLENRRCSWAYYIAEQAGRGIGLAKTLECNLCDHVFEVLDLNKLCCEVLAFNEKVVELHRRFGSQVEGIRRQHIRKSGEFHDVVVMSLLRDDWRALRPTLRYSKITIEI